MTVKMHVNKIWGIYISSDSISPVCFQGHLNNEASGSLGGTRP